MADDHGEGNNNGKGGTEASASNGSIRKTSTHSPVSRSKAFTISAKKKRRRKKLRGMDRFKTEHTGACRYSCNCRRKMQSLIDMTDWFMGFISLFSLKSDTLHALICAQIHHSGPDFTPRLATRPHVERVHSWHAGDKNKRKRCDFEAQRSINKTHLS